MVLTRRNLLLCLTAAVTVATWYAGPGLSYLPIAGLIIVLPIPLALSRLLAARRRRLEIGLLRQPFRRGLLPHRLQFLNMLLLCALLASTLLTGAYSPAAFGFSAGAYRAVLGAFVGGLLVLLLAAQACPSCLEPLDTRWLTVHCCPTDYDLPTSCEPRAHRLAFS